MLTFEASAKIIKQFPFLKEYEHILESVLRDEASYWTAQVPAAGGVSDFSAAVDKACDLIVHWVEHQADFKFDTSSLEEIALFVGQRRSACSFCVLLAKAQNKNEVEHASQP